MAQAYANPARESDPYTLPDVEVFYLSPDDCGEGFDEDGRPTEPGWYWWACFPGCLPDGDPVGPFETEAEALEDAQDIDDIDD